MAQAWPNCRLQNPILCQYAQFFSLLPFSVRSSRSADRSDSTLYCRINLNFRCLMPFLCPRFVQELNFTTCIRKELICRDYLRLHNTISSLSINITFRRLLTNLKPISVISLFGVDLEKLCKSQSEFTDCITLLIVGGLFLKENSWNCFRMAVLTKSSNLSIHILCRRFFLGVLKGPGRWNSILVLCTLVAATRRPSPVSFNVFSCYSRIPST